MKKPLLSIALLFMICFAKAQVTDSVLAKIGQLSDINYELPPRVGNQFLNDYIASKIAVPTNIQPNTSDGAVVVLHIDSNGAVSRVRLVKNLSPTVDKSILQAFNSLPDVKPAYNNGHNAVVDLVMGVSFGQTRRDDPTMKTICYNYSPLNLHDPKNTDRVYMAVQTPPAFPGGDDAFADFLKKAIASQTTGKRKRVQGMVFVSFVVRKDGSLTNLMVLRSPDDELSKAALQIMHKCPAFNAGTQNGHAVNCEFTMPLRLSL